MYRQILSVVARAIARRLRWGSPGVTLAETLVALSIIAVLSGMVVGNYRVSARNDAIGRSAYAVSIALREAQNMALSAETINDVVPSGGYGVFFNGAGSNQYVIFADFDANKRYDSGSSPSEKIEERALEPHIVFDGFAGDNDTPQNLQGEPVAAIFCSPYAATLLYDDVHARPLSECLESQEDLQSSLLITLGIEDGRAVPPHIIRHVRIFASGAIEALNDSERDAALAPPDIGQIIPPSPFLCSSSPPYDVGQPITFTATGGTASGAYRWRTNPPGTPGSAQGSTATTFTTQWKSPGSKTVTVERGNESATCTVTVQKVVTPQPDLFAQNLQRSATSPAAGQAITFTGNIRNDGNAPAGASAARFCIDNANCLTSTTGRIGSDHSVAALGATSSSPTLTSVSWTATVGSHTAYLCADVGNAVTNETSETNNCATQAFTASLPSSPDYVSDSLATAPGNLVAGQKVSFSATIRNQGNAAGGIPSKTSLRLNVGDDTTWEQTFSNMTTGALAPNGGWEAETWANVWTAQAGTHRFEICADAASEIVESDERNCTSQQFTVGAGFPDLVSTSLNASKTSVSQGEALKLSGAIRNDGSVSAAASTAYFCWDTPSWSCGDLFGTAGVGPLTPSQSKNVSVQNKVQGVKAGRHRLYLCADGGRVVDEGPNEKNNCGNWVEVIVQ